MALQQQKQELEAMRCEVEASKENLQMMMKEVRLEATASESKEGKEEELVGKHMIYEYENGWEYEIYYKSHEVIDYRVRSGLVGGRWVKDQAVNIRRLGPAVDCRYMVNWAEPTGTTVCQVVDVAKRSMDTVIFFPRWISLNPGATVCFQNDHLQRIASLREAGPTYPIRVVNEHAFIHTIRHVGLGDDLLISTPPPPLPPPPSSSS